METWTPYAIRDLADAGPESPVPWIMLGAGLAGAALGYLVQWWVNLGRVPHRRGRSATALGTCVHSHHVRVGGPRVGPRRVRRPALGSGLPRLHHPVFEIDGFQSASIDGFWLGVDDSDPRFEDRVVQQLSDLGAIRCARMGRRT